MHEAFPAADSDEPTPGHTPGHMSVRVGAVVVLGDVVVHGLQVADPDVVYVSDHDPGQAPRPGAASSGSSPTKK